MTLTTNSFIWTETSKPKVSIETITPEKAIEYLSSNFRQNRQRNDTNIGRWSVDMKSGRWKLSTDCIAFDTDGRLINGQNRLSAVEKAKVPVQFLVARNFPSDSIGVLDLGKKRMMHERITIAGEPMLAKECSTIRNAMTRWSSRTIGTVYYSQLRHDEFVVKAYNEHKLYLKLMGHMGYIRNSFPGFFISASLMIYAEGISLANRRPNVQGYDPLKRALQFLEIVDTGTLEHLGAFKGKRDGAALFLHRCYRESKIKRRNWSTWDCYARTFKLAKKFELQQDSSRVLDAGEAPFSKDNITEYRSTNQPLIENIISADYLSQKVQNKAADAITRLDGHF
jgi:hypothetical protein